MFVKFANAEVLEVRSLPKQAKVATLNKFAEFGDYRTEDGFMYVRVRAISSRVNKNHDGWPAEELQKAYRTFIGKPIFVDHHNSDPKKARGVVVDAALHVEEDQKTAALDPYYASAPAEHLPPTWIELLLEVDAKKFPKLAKAIIKGDIDGVSMGCNVERSKCSHCGNWASNPDQYCKHILSKGAYFDWDDEFGNKLSKRSYEDCYDIGFFELSFVFDPADETAGTFGEIKTAMIAEIVKEAASGFMPPVPEWEGNPQEFGDVTFGDEIAPGNDEEQNVYEWRLQQLQRMGYDEETAKQLAADKNIDWHDLENQINRGATPDQAARIFARKLATADAELFSDYKNTGWAKEAFGEGHNPDASGAPLYPCPDCQGQNPNCPRCGGVGMLGVDPSLGSNYVTESMPIGWPRKVKPGMQASVKTADNTIPQSEMTTAPDKVDTLRQEQVCPICGSDGMEDGVCPVCNYEEPPEGFDNPDLDKAKEVDEQMHQEDAQQAQQEQTQQPVQPDQAAGGPTGAPQGVPGTAQPITSKTEEPSALKDEQKLSAVPQGTRINTQERPILPVTRKLTDRPLNPKTIKDSVKPVESNRKENMETTTQKTADGATAQGEGVAADERVDVEGVGGFGPDPLAGIEHQNVESTEGGDEVGPHTDTWSGEEGDSLPSADAVGSEAFPKQTAVTKEAEGSDMFAERDPGNGFPFEQKPTRVDLLADLKEEIGEGTNTWSENKANGLEQANPTTSEDPNAVLGGPIGEALSKARAQVFKAFKVADTEIELGMTDPEARYDRVTELEAVEEAALDAQLETLAKVKTAGLKKSTPTTKVAGRMPSFKPVTAAFDLEANSVTDAEVADSLW